MAFNPKTFNYSERQSRVQIWQTALAYVEAGLQENNFQRALYLPVGTRAETQALRHDLHRVRAAYREQNKKDGYVWDGITITVVPLEGDIEWGLKFVHVEAKIAGMGQLKFYDANDNLIATLGKPL